MNSLGINALWAGGGILLYVAILRLTSKRAAVPHWASAMRRYRIYRHQDQVMAQSDGRVGGIVIGALLCVFSYLAAPVLLWRYGARAAILITLAPIANGLVLSSTLNIGDLGSTIGMPMVGRAIVAALIARYDVPLRETLLRKKGYVQIATGWAASRKQALAAFTPQC
jgi:hypothetical protein